MAQYQTRWGNINHSTVCKSDWRNIITSVSRRKDGTPVPNTSMKMQEPAIRSIRAVEKDISKPWKKEFVRVTGTHRTCAYQYQLWRSDPNRYAPPNVGLHTHGLAMDVHTDYLSDRLRKSLLKHGWHQVRPVDEPWHFSFRLVG